MITEKKASSTAIKRTRGDVVFDLVNAGVLIVLMLIVLYPLVYVVSCSFSSPLLVVQSKVLLFPKGLTTVAYEHVFHNSLILSGYGNTILYTLIGTSINLVMTIMAAFPLSQKTFGARKGITFLFTFTMFFSGGMIPMYLTVQQLHIYNTTWAMVLPVAVSAYNLIVCRSFFESGIPVELLEAAKIDGCSDFGFFFKIAIPLSKTIIAVMCLFYATAMWNQFFNALMFLQDDSKMPLQVVLRNLVLMNQSNQMGSSASEMVTKQKLAEQLKYCVVVVSAFPLLCVYPFLQKYFAKGVTIGAVKG